MELRNTKAGKIVAVVKPGTVQIGQVLEHVHECTGDFVNGYVDSGRRDGYGRPIWRKISRYRVTGLGKEFTERGGYIDEEDSRSFRSDGRATKFGPRVVQYAYLEAL